MCHFPGGHAGKLSCANSRIARIAEPAGSDSNLEPNRKSNPGKLDRIPAQFSERRKQRRLGRKYQTLGRGASRSIAHHCVDAESILGTKSLLRSNARSRCGALSSWRDRTFIPQPVPSDMRATLGLCLSPDPVGRPCSCFSPQGAAAAGYGLVRGSAFSNGPAKPAKPCARSLLSAGRSW